MTAEARSGPLEVTVVSLAREVWGSEISMLNLVPHLAERGITVTIAAPGDGAFAAEVARRGIRAVPLRLPPHVGVVGERPGVRSSVVNAAREVPRVVLGARAVGRATRGAQVIHSNSLLANMDCAVAGRAWRRGTVIEIHDLVRPGLSRKLLSATVRVAGLGIAISSPVGKSVSGWAGRGVRLIPQGVDTEVFRPGAVDPAVRAALTARPEEPLVAMIGRLDPVKGVHRLLDAVLELNRAGRACSVVLVGAPSSGHDSYLADVLARATALGDRVRLVGVRSDIPDVLRSVDIVVNASEAEPFGLSVLEAQASGVPVVCADSGGIPDFVGDESTGLLFALDEPTALTGALRRLLESPELSSSLQVGALAQARTRYSLAARADSMARVYREAARSRRWR